MLAIAAREHRHMWKFDVGSAFNESETRGKPIIVRIDKITSKAMCEINPKYKPFMDKDGTIVAKLAKALYGCKQSALLWYDTIAAFFMSEGFTRNSYDKCVFNKMENGVQITILLHVDDSLVTCTNSDMLTALKNAFVKRFKKVTVDKGPIVEHLGVLYNGSTQGKIICSMPAYVQSIIDDSGVVGVAATPAGPELMDIDDKSPSLDVKAKERYHTLVAKILYLAHKLRPEIMLTVNYLATRVNRPTSQDERKLDRLLKYLNKTKHFKMCISAECFELVGEFDASFAVHHDRKSHSGGIVKIGETVVKANSTKQSLVTKSSTEAEQVSASDQASDLLFVMNFMSAQGYDMRPCTIMQDNLSTIAMIRNGRPTGKRNKHIDTRYFFLKDREERGDIKFQYRSTLEMVADCLTKPLQGKLFFKHRASLLNWSEDDDWPPAIEKKVSPVRADGGELDN